jgi:two-component sensor histidine kinase
MTGPRVATPDAEARLARKVEELSALREISRAIGAALDLDTTLALITRKTAEVMRVDSCSIYLLDASGEYLVLKATTGLAAEAVGRARLRFGEGLTGWAAQHGEAVASSNAPADPRFKYLPETHETLFQSLLALPLTAAGRVLGAVNIQTTAVHPWADDEIELLGIIADLAGGALEKARLYDSMRRQILELRTLAEVSETLTSPLYLEQIFRLLVEMAARLFDAALCTVMLTDGDELVLAAAHPAPEADAGADRRREPKRPASRVPPERGDAGRRSPRQAGASRGPVPSERVPAISPAPHRERLSATGAPAESRTGEAPRPRHALRLGAGLPGAAAASGEPAASDHVAGDPRFLPAELLGRPLTARSALSVPLRVRDRTLGVVTVYLARRHAFSAAETTMLQTLANQTALAIENAGLVVKSAMVREMHHRVKNNLQMIAMLLRLQMRDGREVSGREVLTETINRILSIAAVHEILAAEGLGTVSVREMLDRVVNTVTQTMAPPGFTLEARVGGDDVHLPTQQATSLALVVNELLQNAMEHAFPGRSRGQVVIVLMLGPEALRVEVRDDGVGLPDGFALERSSDLGLEIVRTLVQDDLKGRIWFTNAGGARAVITMPRPAAA